MAKKRRGRNRRGQAKSTTPKPTLNAQAAIERGQRALEQNRAADALRLLQIGAELVDRRRQPQVLAQLNALQAEAHFRLGVEALPPLTQMQEMDRALALDPQDQRAHFRRAAALFRQGKWAEAASAVEKAPDHPGAAFVRALTQLAQDQPWTEAGLTTEEANTLDLLKAIQKSKKARSHDELIQRPLLGSNELWQNLVALQVKADSVPADQLLPLVETLPPGFAHDIGLYYAGVAELAQGRKQEATDLWQKATTAEIRAQWFTENAQYLGREAVIGLAEEENWPEIVKLADRVQGPITDRILAETVGTAYFHQGHAAAQAANWQEAAKMFRKASNFMGGRTLSQNLALCEEALENWDAAGDAWREMAKRRPRSQKSPDYMTDAQVAALWAHAADCYDQSEYVNEEVITCLRTAVKYAENDMDLRIKLVDAMLQADRTEAAQNELYRMLEIDSQHIPTLLRLGHLLTDVWGGDPVPYLKTILRQDPNHQEARDTLAMYYLRRTEIMGRSRGILSRFGVHKGNEVIDLLKQAMVDLPGHPQIMLALAMEYREVNDRKRAIQTFLATYEANPKDLIVAGIVMHELLHLDQPKTVEEIFDELHQWPNLLMDFWIDQGERVLGCELGDGWAMKFFDEALLVAEKKQGQDSRALALLKITEAASSEEADEVFEHYVKIIRAEMPRAGILEYLEAQYSFTIERDRAKAKRLLRKAAQLAKKSGDAGLLKFIEDAQSITSGLMNPFLDILKDLGGNFDDFADLF